MTDKKSLEAAIESVRSNDFTPEEYAFVIKYAEAHAASLREPLGNEGWRDIKDAPFNERVLVLTHGGAIFSAVKHPDGFMDEDGETIGGWTACNAHPECWSEGACWSSNVDDFPSDPPAMWMTLPSPPSTKPEEKE